MCQQFPPRSLEILHKQFHDWATDFVILNDKQVEWIGIMIAQGRIMGAVLEAENT